MSDLNNLDLESVEALLQQKTTDRNGTDKEERHHKKKKHRSSRSRSKSTSRSHKKKSRKRSRSSSKDRKRKHSKSKRRSKSRSKDREHRHRDRDSKRRSSRDKEKDRERDREKEKEKKEDHVKEDDNIDLETIEKRQKERIEKEEEERKKQEAKQFEEKMNEAKKQLEDARRDDSTCLILNLSIKSQEKEIYEFFNNHNCGKIRDIRVIRDPRSGKSKGVAYIEFYAIESVNKAIAQSGNELQGSKLRILPSKAEINRTAAHAKQLKQNKNPTDQQHQQATGAMRIFVSGLTDQLADIEEKDLRALFAPFGEVERVEMHRDDVTGKSKGYAFVVYRNSGDAKRAIIEMNGFVVNGKKIKVEAIQAGMANMLQDNSNFDLDDDSGANYLQTAQSRAMLMQKLQREGQEGVPGVDLTGQGQAAQPVEPAQPAKAQTSLLPTNCILLSNMFVMDEVDLSKEPTYFVDLKEEIEEECNKYGEVLQTFIEANKEGNIWVKFREGRGASLAYQTLNNKFFSGRKILCSYVTESTFNSKLKG